jgi:hypothetical protein
METTSSGVHIGASASFGFQKDPWTIATTEQQVDTLVFDPLDSTLSRDTVETSDLSPVLAIAFGTSVPLKSCEPYVLFGWQNVYPLTPNIPSSVLSYSTITGEAGVRVPIVENLDIMAGSAFHLIPGSTPGNTWSVRLDLLARLY